MLILAINYVIPDRHCVRWQAVRASARSHPRQAEGIGSQLKFNRSLDQLCWVQEKQARKIAGRAFMLTSPEQVAEVLYGATSRTRLFQFANTLHADELKCPKIAEAKGGRSKAKGAKHHSTG